VWPAHRQHAAMLCSRGIEAHSIQGLEARSEEQVMKRLHVHVVISDLSQSIGVY
jgi:hypothetical protein